MKPTVQVSPAPCRIAYEPPGGIESWNRDRLAAWQLERLREVVSYARVRVPFYARLWADARVGEDSLSSMEDIGRLPIVEKQDLVNAGQSWSASTRGPIGFSTRGTSGEPLLVWLSPEEEEAYIAPTMRGFRWAGFRSGMTALLMSPVWHRLAACEVHAVACLGGRSAFFWGSMGSDYMDSFLGTLGRVSPQFVTTTAPFLLSLIRRDREHPLALRDLFRSVCSIVAVGLPLTPRLREFLRDSLQVGDIFERSGTQEGAALDECSMHSAPHAHEDVCYLEVLDAGGRAVPAGTRGELVVTKLTAAGSIFVRYRTGDIAAFLPGACPCGCGFRRLKIYGRPESSVMAGGRRVTAYDARLCVEEDPALIGRNVLLIRNGATVLNIAIEGAATNQEKLVGRMREWLGVARVQITWLGDLKINWGFRQIIEGREIRRLAG
ncbi:MAG: hypothetical protein WA005_02800 [Candidatus Binataceae bacterium]